MITPRYLIPLVFKTHLCHQYDSFYVYYYLTFWVIHPFSPPPPLLRLASSLLRMLGLEEAPLVALTGQAVILTPSKV